MIEQRRFGDAAMWRARAAPVAPPTMPCGPLDGPGPLLAVLSGRKWPWTSVPPTAYLQRLQSAENSRRKRKSVRARRVHNTTYSSTVRSVGETETYPMAERRRSDESAENASSHLPMTTENRQEVGRSGSASRRTAWQRQGCLDAPVRDAAHARRARFLPGRPRPRVHPLQFHRPRPRDHLRGLPLPPSAGAARGPPVTRAACTAAAELLAPALPTRLMDWSARRLGSRRRRQCPLAAGRGGPHGKCQAGRRRPPGAARA